MREFQSVRVREAKNKMSTTSGAINSSEKRWLQRTCGFPFSPRRFRDRGDKGVGAGLRYFRVSTDRRRWKVDLAARSSRSRIDEDNIWRRWTQAAGGPFSRNRSRGMFVPVTSVLGGLVIIHNVKRFGRESRDRCLHQLLDTTVLSGSGAEIFFFFLSFSFFLASPEFCFQFKARCPAWTLLYMRVSCTMILVRLSIRFVRFPTCWTVLKNCLLSAEMSLLLI